MRRRGFLGRVLAVPAALVGVRLGAEKTLGPVGLRGLVDDGTFLRANVWGVGPPITEAQMMRALGIVPGHGTGRMARVTWRG